MVCPYDYTRPGGVQSHIRHLGLELSRRGHSVRVIAPRPAAREDSGPSEEPLSHLFAGSVWPCRFSGSRIDLAWAGRADLEHLREALRRAPPDVIHYHTMWNPFLPLQVWALTRRVPSVATFHDAPPDTPFGRLAGSVLMPLGGFLISRMVDVTLAVSEVPARILRRLLPAERVVVVPNGVDPSLVEPAPPRRDGDCLTILYVGRLEERKGVIDLLRAFARLEARYAHVRLVVAGDGCLGAALQRHVREQGLRGVTFTGRISEEEKLSRLRSADIFCSPARYGESFGIVLLEAMACGLPVVAAANPGYRAVLQGEGADLLYPPGDVDALEDRLLRLVEDRELRLGLGTWGTATARAFTWPLVADRLLPLYRSAMRARGDDPNNRV